MSHCIFCKIINKELPVDIVYENEHVLAFLDIAPINKGHTLVIPKSHHSSITTPSDDEMLHMMKVASQIGRALMKGCDYDGFNLHLANGNCAGQVVDHAHLHVIPRIGTDGFHWNWRSQKYEDGEKQELIEKMHSRMKLDES
ncbi:MAG: HIT family protein [Lentisphaeraceae bacterium]|nr:HIT family protein [Lentisphaeraceae bacterium]